MFASTFIFRAGQYDAEFHRLDQQIAEVARSIPGYLGEETWENSAAGLIQNVYYWDTEEALLELIRHPAHIEAKAKQARWLDGYRVVIAEIKRGRQAERAGGLALRRIFPTPRSPRGLQAQVQAFGGR